MYIAQQAGGINAPSGVLPAYWPVHFMKCCIYKYI